MIAADQVRFARKRSIADYRHAKWFEATSMMTHPLAKVPLMPSVASSKASSMRPTSSDSSLSLSIQLQRKVTVSGKCDAVSGVSVEIGYNLR